MNALRSPFLSGSVQPSKLILTPTTIMLKPTAKTTRTSKPPFPNSSPLVPVLNVRAVRIEEKPKTSTRREPTTTTTTLPRSANPPSPSNNIPSPPPSRNKSTATRRVPSPPQRRPVVPTLPTLILNAVDDVINNFIDPPSKAYVDPRHVLRDNYAPVLDELPPTECEVIEGSLPACLDGAYIRNGPNPQFLPRGPYHLFDGDGMLHSIKISKGKATLCSRYVKTYKYTKEQEVGGPLVPNVFSFNSLTSSATRGALSFARMLASQFNLANGFGLANTSLAFFADRLYALGESDMPYSVRVTPNGDIETLGRQDFDGKLMISMTAHPKVDLDTGEAFAFRYGPVPPFLTYFRFDPTGNKQPDVPIFSLMTPSMLHDFAISKKYAIFAEMQLGMSPFEMIFSGGSPVGTDPGKVPRIGVLPRYAKDETEMKWFNVPGFNPMHLTNAWDEEDAIVLVAPNVLCIEHALENLDLVHSMLEKVRIDLKTGTVRRTPISARNLDFAVINPAYTGKKNKYVYAAVGDPMPSISGVVKLDVSKADQRQDCTVACRMYGRRCYGGEPFFVAREPDNPEAEEDDGYVVSYVHDEVAGESKFLVMDAKSPELDIVAAVKLPRRVPYGFHGLFVRESDLSKLM
ncbi:putative carotenoid cleavage dioxygenase 4, chloroplastic [Turnera subulata]|uniref:Carotenoid cleavage dioxygenase 4, chloroplastic n=1 Tax=Turnera subulata TaxID=218843 RepID=A0A9Q0GL39_9ROSI|nr:putative carotenoid cleavage dioxygenase 4, chloroplastic [Turnera subulata]